VLTVGDELRTPKSHLMAHLIVRAGFLGHPANYSTWEDESKNRLLKAVLRNVSKLDFEAQCFHRLESHLCDETKRRKML